MKADFNRILLGACFVLGASGLLSSCGKSSYLRGEAPQGKTPQEMGKPVPSPTEPDLQPPVVVPVPKDEGQKPSQKPNVEPQKKPSLEPQKPSPVPSKPGARCTSSENAVFPLAEGYRVVREGGFLTAYVRSVEDGYADFTNLYAAFGDWKGMRFNGGYIEDGKYVAAKYVFHLVSSAKGLSAIVSGNDGDRVVGEVVDFNGGAGMPRFMTIKMASDVCMVQYGDTKGNLVSGGAGWMLLQ